MPAISKTSPAFILASGSPRRRELTEALGWRPRVCSPDIEEVRAPAEPARQYTERLASQKAAHVIATLHGQPELPEWVLAADTIVTQGARVLEKPADAQEARAMLEALSGRAHEVITSFCWASRHEPGRRRVESVITRVHFRPLAPESIARYGATGEPMDKAGAYGIQGIAGAIVERIEGSYSGVVGLPVGAVVRVIEELGGLEGFPFDGAPS